MSSPNLALLSEFQSIPRATSLERATRSLAELVADLGPMQEAVDISDLLAGLAHAIRREVGADAVLVSRYDQERDLVCDGGASVLAPATLNFVAEEYSLDAYPATREVLDTGKALEISVSDPGADPSETRFLSDYGFSRSLVCRLVHSGAPFAIVEAYRTEDRPFRHDDSARVDVLCAFASSALTRLELAAQLEDHYTTTMEALVSALEARDPHTEAHAGRIRDLSTALAVALKLPSEERRAVKLGSILHDVGKIGVPDSILLKEGSLDEREWALMRRHPVIGEQMLRSVDFLKPAWPVVRHHHERWDGRGYPDGLLGRDIPIGARIVAVCDSFDAMTSDRPYRKALPLEIAFEELTRNAGSQFDPACAELLVEVVSSLGQDRVEERLVRYAD
jgi:hypothetical protein